MNRNLLIKAAFVRNDVEQKHFAENDFVRTDFILKNVFSYLLGDNRNFTAINPINRKEKDVFEGLKETLSAFRDSYVDSVRSLCAEIGMITEHTIDSILLGVSNEVFSEGITWSRIIAFFVFVGEMTIMCISRNLSPSIVDVIYECFSELVKEKLCSWVEDHDGWEGITSLSVVTQQENFFNISNPSWAKSILYNTVRVIGTLASVANTVNNGFI